ncbi:hypothetical protein PRK78_002849 [Emydomyces testavorans]|uniref:Uncharacterized protein n=1 Tax=Emydomyces testavorans TaxID=2070801 RepID=A0AAF0DH43_9EURO|nr:hypothetical protein PRK78_002849 [Emydomyces testavorans]
MPGITSRFIEHLDPEEPRTSSEADVRLEEILAEENYRVRSSNSSTSSSSKESLQKEWSDVPVKRLGWKKIMKIPQFGSVVCAMVSLTATYPLPNAWRAQGYGDLLAS